MNQAGFEASALNCIYFPSTQELPLKGYSVCSSTLHMEIKKKKKEEILQLFSSNPIQNNCYSEVLIWSLLFYWQAVIKRLRMD